VFAVAKQVAAVVIIDNGSADAELEPILKLVEDGIADLVRNPQNLGLATALNQGVKWGQERGLAWMATFDQDTLAEPYLVAEAEAIYDVRQTDDIAAIGAGWVSRPEWDLGCSDPGGIELACVITSGTLHSIAIWQALSGFREDFFVDYVDTEYCLRARQHGYKVIRACRVTMGHLIGNPKSRSIYIRSVTPSNHSAIRRYYITRNRMRVWRAYWRREPGYVAFDVKAAAKELVKLVLAEDDRAAKLRAIARGIRDSMRGVSGPLLS
jgi:rhamnosyltransferase